MDTSTPLGTELVIYLVATVILFWGAAKLDRARKTKSAPPAIAFLAIFSAGVVILIMALRDNSQPAPTMNPVAVVVSSPPAPPKPPPSPAKSAAYQAGYDFGLKLGAYEHPELVEESEQAIINGRRQLERTGWAGAANDGFGGNLDYVQGFTDAYADHGLISGGRFTVSP